MVTTRSAAADGGGTGTPPKPKTPAKTPAKARSSAAGGRTSKAQRQQFLGLPGTPALLALLPAVLCGLVYGYLKLWPHLEAMGFRWQGLTAFRHLVAPWLPQHAVNLDVPDHPEPEQSFLLGNRWADYGLSLLVALALPQLRALLNAMVYEPYANHMYRVQRIDMDKTKRVEWLRKFKESAWKLTIFATFTITAFLVSYQEAWFTDTRYYWLGCTHFPPCNLSVSKGVLFFYALETGFYMQAIHFLAVHEVRRKDWLESMVHHVATVILLVYSYYVNFTRVGVMVLLVHDVSDIFLEAAKLCRCTKQEGLGLAMFVVFVPTWILTRNVYFPLVTIRSTLTEPLKYAAIHGIDNVEPHYTIFNSLLLLLMVLHVYWTYLILAIAFRKLFKGKLDDIREKDVED